MACATLKRSHDWDPLGSPTSSPSTGGANPSHHHHSRPAKRHCSSHSSHSSNSFLTPLKDPSPFGEVEPRVTPDGITSRINQEVKRLSSRRQLMTMPVNNNSIQHTICSNQFSHQTSCVPSSPEKMAPLVPCNSPALGLMAPGRREQPIFTFKQVGLICEKLLREREAQLREEYDKVLGQKLAEQYDTFVKFTYDQIQKRFDSGSTPSYLS